MTSSVNAKHERFAQALANGRTQLQAHGDAGYKAHAGNASKLAADKKIIERVAEILAEREKMHSEATNIATEALGVDKAWIMAKLKENALRAMQAEPVLDSEGNVIGDYKYGGSVANRALELLGKEQGMFIDRKEVRKVGELERMDDAAIIDRLGELRVKALGRTVETEEGPRKLN